MTSQIIYHDFREPGNSPALALTASALNKGRRLLRAADKINTAVSIACIFLCSACTLLTLLAVLML